MNSTELFWKNAERIRKEKKYSKAYVYDDFRRINKNIPIEGAVTIADRLGVPASVLFDYDNLTYQDCLEVVAVKNKLGMEELEEVIKKYKYLKKKYC